MKQVLKTCIRTKIFFGFLLIIAGYQPVGGQYSSSLGRSKQEAISEKIYVHRSKSVYVAGEYLDYKVYIVNGKLPLQQAASKILYFTLSGYNDTKALQWRVNINSSIINGSYKLPDNLTSGVYKLIVYTNFSRNNTPGELFSCSMLIVNLAEEVPDTFYRPGADINSNVDSLHPTFRLNNPEQDNSRIIEIGALKPVYRPGENINLEISLGSRSDNDSASVSLSVTERVPFSDILTNDDIKATFEGNKDMHGEPFLYNVEDNGYIMAGRIIHKKDGMPLAGGNVLLGVLDSISPRIQYAVTDSTGCFCFYLKPLYDNREVFLQLADNPDNSEITWELEDKKITYPGPWSPMLLNSDQKAFLNHTKDLRIVEAIYAGPVENKQHIAAGNAVNYFDNPDQVIYPSDYADLVNFKEISDNILPSVRFSNRKNQSMLQVFNPTSGEWNENCAVMLNGLPFADLNYIATLGTRDIKRIEVIFSGFLVGNLTYNGIVSIYTFDGKIPANYIKNHAFSYQNVVIFSGEEEKSNLIPVETNGWNHIPDFNSNIYWEPELKLKGGGKQVISFQASQLTGEYDISIQGVDSGGKPLSTGASFVIKQEARL